MWAANANSALPTQPLDRKRFPMGTWHGPSCPIDHTVSHTSLTHKTTQTWEAPQDHFDFSKLLLPLLQPRKQLGLSVMVCKANWGTGLSEKAHMVW